MNFAGDLMNFSWMERIQNEPYSVNVSDGVYIICGEGLMYFHTDRMWRFFLALARAFPGGGIALILKGVLPLKKIWVLAAPLLIAGIGFLLEMILPLPFNSFPSGFESFGWIVMFLGAYRP